LKHEIAKTVKFFVQYNDCVHVIVFSSITHKCMVLYVMAIVIFMGYIIITSTSTCTRHQVLVGTRYLLLMTGNVLVT